MCEIEFPHDRQIQRKSRSGVREMSLEIFNRDSISFGIVVVGNLFYRGLGIPLII